MKKTIAICLLMLMIAGVASAAKSNTFRVVQANQDVALDLNPDSAFWRGAMPIYLEVNPFGKPLPAYRTEVLSRWTKDYLYLLYVCPYQKLHLKPNPRTKTETFALWDWDVAEIFIGSDFQNIRRYKEFEISPQAEWVDLDINLDNPHHTDGWVWNSGFQVSARIDREKKIWYGEMKIPFVAIAPRVPHPGMAFRVNLFRKEGSGAGIVPLVWQPTMQQTFHVPERFGTMILTAKK